jgi:hypothetical protein
MSSTAYYSGGIPKEIKPSASNETALEFLAQPNLACSSAWILARAGINANGPLQVQLFDEYGNALSDVSDVNGSSTSRIKMTGVMIPADAFPPVVRVRVTNRSTASHSYASVMGVLLEYS